MLLLQPLVRTLWLALLAPALLAPSGWQWRLCFCEQMSAAAAAERSCCEEEEAPIEEGNVEEGCCDEDPMTGRHDCSGCHSVDAGVGALACFSAPSVPLAPPFCALILEVRAPRNIDRANGAYIGRSQAPPGLRGRLPLRI
ncbi:MAG: hypothetical protein FJ294_15400 [Planctomycetes bacterium]|nr:hypothetical protein [Planctomycetota bacterium]